MAEDETEQYYWVAAFKPGPCGCPFDANACIDKATGYVIEWECEHCGEVHPGQHDAPENVAELDRLQANLDGTEHNEMPERDNG